MILFNNYPTESGFYCTKGYSPIRTAIDQNHMPIPFRPFRSINTRLSLPELRVPRQIDQTVKFLLPNRPSIGHAEGQGLVNGVRARLTIPSLSTLSVSPWNFNFDTKSIQFGEIQCQNIPFPSIADPLVVPS